MIRVHAGHPDDGLLAHETGDVRWSAKSRRRTQLRAALESPMRLRPAQRPGPAQPKWSTLPKYYEPGKYE